VGGAVLPAAEPGQAGQVRAVGVDAEQVGQPHCAQVARGGY